MLYRNVEQGIRCERLKAVASEANRNARNWEDQAIDLEQRNNSENGRPDDLRRQADRTGDHEAFEPDIRRLEDYINNLQRQVIVEEDNARQWRDEVGQLENEMAGAGCYGFA